MPNVSSRLGYFSARELGEAFRAERKALGRSQAWVADQCKCRRQTIIDLEHGKNVKVFTLIAALTALGKGMCIVDRRIDIDLVGELFTEDD